MYLDADDSDRCDPLGTFDSPQTLSMSVISLFCSYVCAYAMSLWLLHRLANRFK
jgi:hypothetical protein